MSKFNRNIKADIQTVEDAMAVMYDTMAAVLHDSNYLPSSFNMDGYEAVANAVLENPKFVVWCGSPSHHHTFDGGLAVHTAQVMDASMKMLDAVSPCYDDYTPEQEYLRRVMFFATLYHDIGKLEDYAKKEDGTWTHALPHRYETGHISKGFVIWNHNAMFCKLPSHFIDDVGHCILAHHGRLEWGSPVEPQTPVAYILHAADMLSAHYLETRRVN